jgi:hypothetical protein
MATPVVIGLLVGFVVGGACMATWAAGRIGEEAARQFDRGFERGRWLHDLAAAAGSEPTVRAAAAGRGLLVAGRSPGHPGPGQEPPSLLVMP